MLDDIKQIAQVDKADMLEVLTDFPNQLRDALTILEAANIGYFYKVDNVIITGMGASAISGDLIASLYRDKIDVPIYVNRDYDLPKWARKETLTIFLSYSGNTEETISAFKLAHQKKCQIICISSGGKLKEMSERRDATFIQIPSGFQPRAATGYLLPALLHILKRSGLLKMQIDQDLNETIQITEQLVHNIMKTVPQNQNIAKQHAYTLHTTLPHIYGWGVYSAVAYRWQTQFNENSKIISRYATIPECTHNDIIGWSANENISKQSSCILFRDKNLETVYLTARLDYLKKLFEATAVNTIEITPQGKSKLAKMIYLMILGDFISCYLAILRKIDPTPIDLITDLKNRLTKI